MDAVFERLVTSIDFSKLRIGRPSNFVFFCGGADKPANGSARLSLRQYLLNKTTFQKRIQAELVLAEQATALYRDTQYSNLVDFEADIAHIAAIVLVIAESAGSLAELGAFALHSTIGPSLRVLIKEEHYNQESFIRFGPIKLLQNINEEYVGVFPWRTFAGGNLVLSSVDPHYRNISEYINKNVVNTQKTYPFDNKHKFSAFITIYWILHLLVACPIGTIEEYVSKVLPDHGLNIRDMLYCMKIGGWIDSHAYGGQTYYFSLIDKDPFEYRFTEQAPYKDSLRWKADLASSLKRSHPVAMHVRKLVAANKRRAL